MFPKTKSPLERTEQKALVQWLNLHPVLKKFFCKIDNEGERKTLHKNGKIIPIGQIHANKMGLRPGVSDIFIYYPSKTYAGLWLEVKRNKKYTKSEMQKDSWVAQEKFIESVRSVGYAGFFCYGWIHGKEIIENYLRT